MPPAAAVSFPPAAGRCPSRHRSSRRRPAPIGQEMAGQTCWCMPMAAAMNGRRCPGNEGGSRGIHGLPFGRDHPFRLRPRTSPFLMRTRRRTVGRRWAPRGEGALVEAPAVPRMTTIRVRLSVRFMAFTREALASRWSVNERIESRAPCQAARRAPGDFGDASRKPSGVQDAGRDGADTASPLACFEVKPYCPDCTRYEVEAEARRADEEAAAFRGTEEQAARQVEKSKPQGRSRSRQAARIPSDPTAGRTWSQAGSRAGPSPHLRRIRPDARSEAQHPRRPGYQRVPPPVLLRVGAGYQTSCKRVAFRERRTDRPLFSGCGPTPAFLLDSVCYPGPAGLSPRPSWTPTATCCSACSPSRRT
jgi:hypothetical protein